jgi:hypothetical protein
LRPKFGASDRHSRRTARAIDKKVALAKLGRGPLLVDCYERLTKAYRTAGAPHERTAHDRAINRRQDGNK